MDSVAEFLGIERTRAGLASAAALGRRGGARPQYAEEDIERAVAAFRAGGTYKAVAATVMTPQGRQGYYADATQAQDR